MFRCLTSLHECLRGSCSTPEARTNQSYPWIFLISIFYFFKLCVWVCMATTPDGSICVYVVGEGAHFRKYYLAPGFTSAILHSSRPLSTAVPDARRFRVHATVRAIPSTTTLPFSTSVSVVSFPICLTLA